jgi:hypothetical protein
MIVVRVILGALVAMLAVVLVMPAVVLLDLLTGGTGLGLCASGLGTCETPFYTLIELLMVFTVLVFVLGFLVTACLRVLSRQARRPVGL